MTGGMLMKDNCDGYSSSPQELEQAELEHDDLEALEKLHSRLEALMKAKAHLAPAHEWLETEGVMLHGTLPDMMDQIDLMKDLIHRTIIEGEE